MTPSDAPVFDITTFFQECQVEVGEHTAGGDSDASVELLLVAHGEPHVALDDVRLLVVTLGVAGELEDLGVRLTRACPPSPRRARHGAAPAHNILRRASGVAAVAVGHTTPEKVTGTTAVTWADDDVLYLCFRKQKLAQRNITWAHSLANPSPENPGTPFLLPPPPSPHPEEALFLPTFSHLFDCQ